MDSDLIPSVKQRGMTARELIAKSERKIIIDQVKQQEQLIDAEILRAHKAGFNSYTHALPLNFSLNNMSKADAQAMVYSELLATYLAPETEGGKGYDEVYIDMKVEPPTLIIKWQNGMDEAERTRRVNFIKSRSIHNNKK